MTAGQHIATALLSMDWSRVVLEISARKRWRLATVAGHVGSCEQHIRRLARGEVREPRIQTALRLLDLHAEASKCG